MSVRIGGWYAIEYGSKVLIGQCMAIKQDDNRFGYNGAYVAMRFEFNEKEGPWEMVSAGRIFSESEAPGWATKKTWLSRIFWFLNP